MLRAVVVALLVANLGFWAWRAGAFEALGLGPSSERDPARLAQQVQPEAVRVVPAAMAAATLRVASAPLGSAAAASAAVAAAQAPQCLEAGPFAPAALDAAEQALAAAGLPAGSWRRSSLDAAPQYAVVLGPFNSGEGLQTKREEIGRLKLPIEAVELPGKASGDAPQAALALGRYDSRSAAEAGLDGFSKRGVRTARVATLRTASSQMRLRIDNASPALTEQLRALSAAALGGGFAPCVAEPAAPTAAASAAR